MDECATRRDVSNSKKKEKRRSFSSFWCCYFFWFFLVSLWLWLFVCVSCYFSIEFLPHGTSRQASSHGASVLRQDIACRRSQKLLLGIFLHTYTARAVRMCLYVCVCICMCVSLCVCVSARCSMSGDAGSGSTGCLLKFCFSSASLPSLSASLSLCLSLFRLFLFPPPLPLPLVLPALALNFISFWNFGSRLGKRQKPNAGAALPTKHNESSAGNAASAQLFFLRWEIMLSAMLSLNGVRSLSLATISLYCKGILCIDLTYIFQSLYAWIKLLKYVCVCVGSVAILQAHKL